MVQSELTIHRLGSAVTASSYTKSITLDFAATAGVVWKLAWCAAQTQFKFLPARRKMH